jgi:hypothetical protein
MHLSITLLLEKTRVENVLPRSRQLYAVARFGLSRSGYQGFPEFFVFPNEPAKACEWVQRAGGLASASLSHKAMPALDENPAHRNNAWLNKGHRVLADGPGADGEFMKIVFGMEVLA